MDRLAAPRRGRNARDAMGFAESWGEEGLQCRARRSVADSGWRVTEEVLFSFSNAATFEINRQ